MIKKVGLVVGLLGWNYLLVLVVLMSMLMFIPSDLPPFFGPR